MNCFANNAERLAHNLRLAAQQPKVSAELERPIVTEADRLRGYTELEVELVDGTRETVQVRTPQGRHSPEVLFSIVPGAAFLGQMQTALDRDEYFVNALTVNSNRMVCEAIALLIHGYWSSAVAHVAPYLKAGQATPFWKINSQTPHSVNLCCASGHELIFASEHISAAGELSKQFGNCPRGHCALSAPKIILDQFAKTAAGVVLIKGVTP